MAIRRWLVQPDTIKDTQFGPLPVVSREAFVDSVLDAVSLCDRAGGGFTVFCSRERTDVEHEMVTTAVMVEWRDRTDAKPQPERPVQAAPAPPLPEDPEPEELEAALVGAPADGLDERALPEEDLSEIPESAR